jgi:outer membrane protein assembly factor BamB
MTTSICLVNRKQTASFRIVGSTLTIATIWLTLVVANTSAHAQMSDDVSNPGVATTTPSLADWTQFHRDNMQRWNPYETALSVNNVGSLKVKWRIPSVVSDSFEPSSPAVVNGVVYFGSGDGNVYALDTSTGSKLWSFASQGTQFSAPAVGNWVVYIGAGDGHVYALNASTGVRLWSFAAAVSRFSSPAVANGVIYIGGDDANVYALNAGTGVKLWNFTAGSSVFSSPALANGVVYVGSADGFVYALNAGTGNKLWSFATNNSVNSSPAVANGAVYIGSEDGSVYALNAMSGAKLWSFDAGISVQSSPAVANGIVYIGSNARTLYALNANTGALLWGFATRDTVPSSPAVANGVVYIGSTDGNLYALNASTGARLWSYDTGTSMNSEAMISSPTIVDGVLYTSAGDFFGKGNIYAFSLSADLFLRLQPSSTSVHQGDLLTYAFPVWNLGPRNAVHEVLNTQVPGGTTFNYIRISGTPGLGTCTHPPYLGTGQIICHENSSMAPNTTWTVRLTVRVTAPSGTVITESAATMADTFDPNMANNTATVSIKVQ